MKPAPYSVRSFQVEERVDGWAVLSRYKGSMCLIEKRGLGAKVFALRLANYLAAERTKARLFVGKR